MSRPYLRATFLIGVLLTCGCSGSEPTMTMDQAHARIDAIGAEAAMQFPGTTIVAAAGHSQMFCDPDGDFRDVEGRGRYTASRIWFVDPPVPAGQIEDSFDRIVESLPRSGWTVLDDSRGPSSSRVSFQNDADGFRLTYNGGDGDGVRVTVSSPCLWPDGSPRG